MLKDGLEHTVEVHEDELGGDFIMSASPIHDEKNELIGCVHVSRDITGRKNAENDLEKLVKELKRSNLELEQFAYVASHDLQEPLRMVTSFTQLLERDYGDKLGDDGKEYIKFAVDGAKRMKNLIRGPPSLL